MKVISGEDTIFKWKLETLPELQENAIIRMSPLGEIRAKLG